MRFLSYDDLKARGIRYSRMHIHRLVHAGKFPRPVKLGTGPNGTNFWPDDEIDQYLNNCIAPRDAAIAAKR